MRPHASRTPQDQFREWQDWLEITREGRRQGGTGKQSHLQNRFVTIAAPLERLVWYSLVPLPRLPIGIWVRSKSLPQPLGPAHLPNLTNTSVACHLPDPLQSLREAEFSPQVLCTYCSHCPNIPHTHLPPGHQGPVQVSPLQEALPNLLPPQTGSCPCSSNLLRVP